jgi:hypothetical protein
MGWRTEARRDLDRLPGLAADARAEAQHARDVANQTRSRRARRSLLESAETLEACAASYDSTAANIRALLRGHAR